jgi:hypothetical protein
MSDGNHASPSREADGDDTITTETNTMAWAHRLVLAAASPYFSALLRDVGLEIMILCPAADAGVQFSCFMAGVMVTPERHCRAGRVSVLAQTPHES